MLSEELISAVCGPPIAANTAVPKDVGIYAHTLSPAWGVKASFKKSSIGPNCLAVSENHVFAAQDNKSHVHVYSRQRGTQETLVSFQERIRSVALAGNVLVLGTAEGRLILWEVSIDCFCLLFHSLLLPLVHHFIIIPCSHPPTRVPAHTTPIYHIHTDRLSFHTCAAPHEIMFSFSSSPITSHLHRIAQPLSPTSMHAYTCRHIDDLQGIYARLPIATYTHIHPYTNTQTLSHARSNAPYRPY